MVILREIFGTLFGISLIAYGLAEKLPPSILLQRPTMDFLVFTQETRGRFGLGFSGEIPKSVNPKKIFDSSCHPFSKKLVKILKIIIRPYGTFYDLYVYTSIFEKIIFLI